MTTRPIQNCQVRFQFKCPKQWESLQESAEEGVRWCGQCLKPVYLCQSTQEAASHAREGHCVAVPVGLAASEASQDEGEQVDALVRRYRVPGIQLRGRELDPDLFKLVSWERARRYGLVPLSRTGSWLLVAMSDPTHDLAIDELKFYTGYNVEVRVATPRDIQEALERAERDKPRDVELGVVACEEEEPEPEPFEGPVGKLLWRLLLDAHQQKEAQVQIDITDAVMFVRHGLAGSQQDILRIPSKLRAELVYQLRRASHALHAQEGRLHIQTSKQRVDYQVRFNPTLLGEEIVLQPLPLPAIST